MKEIYIDSKVLKEILSLACKFLGTGSSDTQLGLEVSGLIIGCAAKDRIIIHSILTGDQESKPFYTNLGDDFLASAAKKLADGEISGNIYGWFHSHVGIGVFLSSLDVKTLRNMQRLSPDTFAIVVDPLSKERFGFFRYDFKRDSPYRIDVRVFGTSQ